MREQRSLLLSSGHWQAATYPLGMLWEEAQIVVERKNQDAASNTSLLHAAAAAVMSKKGNDALRKILKELTSG